MGALIQTKGTQLLASFFSNRFSPANLPTMRGITNPSTGVPLWQDFAFGRSLLDISDAYVGAWTDGSDLLYPTTTITTGLTGTAGSNILTFTNALPAAAPQVANGMPIDDMPSTGVNAIPNGATVTNIDGTRRVVTISQNLVQAIAAGPPITPIVFSNAGHANLWKRWRHYLKNDLLAENHSAIQTAIHEALVDDGPKGYHQITFQSIESKTQKAVYATEFGYPAGTIDVTKKYMQILLLTARTTAPQPIDPQS